MIETLEDYIDEFAPDYKELVIEHINDSANLLAEVMSSAEATYLITVLSRNIDLLNNERNQLRNFLLELEKRELMIEVRSNESLNRFQLGRGMTEKIGTSNLKPRKKLGYISQF